MKIKQTIQFLALIAGLSASVAQAANGTWTNLAGGSWPVATNWSGGTVAGGTGFLAKFDTLNITSNTTVTLDGPTTIGNLQFSDITAPLTNWIVNTGSGGPLTLEVSSGSPTITVSAAQTTINAVISGTNGFTKAGAGVLVLTAANTFSNNVTLTAGTLNINSDAALGAVTNVINFNGATLQVPASTTVTLNAARSNICNSASPARYDVGAASTLTVPGVVQCFASTNSNIAKVGLGTLILSGGMGGSVSALFNLAAGKVSIQGGTWSIQTPATDGKYFRVAGLATYEQTGGIMNAPFYAVLGQDAANANTSTGIFSGGTFNAPGELMVGRFNPAVMTVSGSALLNLNQLKLGESGTYTTTCNLDGGTIACNHVAARGTTATSILNLNSGTLQAKSDNSFFFGGSPVQKFLTQVNVKSGGAIIDSQGFAITIPQALDHDAGLGGTPDGGLTKLGSGTLTLSGTNTYTGNTTNSAGTLLVNGSLAGGAVINSGTLGGNGVIGGAVTMASGTTLQPGTNASAIGTLTITNLTLASGSTLSLDIDPLGAADTDLIPTRDLAVSGPVVISFPIPASGSFTQSRYVIMTYSASASGLANLSLPPSFADNGYALAIDTNTPNEVAITVGNLSGPLSLTWLGGLNGDAWDINTTTNWLDASLNPQKFYNADPVTFDDSAASTTVNVTTTVAPGLVVFNNTSSNYTASGAGRIISTAGLSKTGSGNLTLNVPYEGGAVTNAGGGVMALTNASIATRLQVDAGSTVVMTGSNSLNGELTLDPANAGGATAMIASGGYLNITAGAFRLPNSSNLLVVAGAGSTFNASAATNFQVGSSASSANNRVILKDGGAWTNINNNFSLPNGAGANDNHLILTNGGQFAWKPAGAGNFLIGFGTGSYDNSLQVLGAASTLDLGGKSLYAGRKGTNNTALFDAGVGTNIAAIFIGDQGNNDGSGVTVQNGARLYVANSIDFLTAAFSENSFFTLTGAASAVQAAGLGLVRTNGTFNFQGGALTLNSASVGNGQVFTVGDGAQLATLTLGGGGFTFSNGLAISANASLKGSGTVTVGNVTVNGTLAPGTSVGALVFSNNLTLAGTTLMEIDKANTANDSATVQGTLTYGGTLTVTNLGGTLAAGDTFQLFTFTGSPGSFSSTTLPTLGDGLAWTNKLEVDGTIEVIGPPVAPLTLAYSNSAPNVITFSWTNGYFKLQWQTNALSVGLSTNWMDYPGGATSPVNVTNTTIIPSAFFRLAPEVDPNTLTGKLMMGYQGWFAAPGDGSAYNRWVHWFRNNNPAATNATFDFWPDTSELDADELFDTSMTYPNGAPAKLYSAYKQKTVVRHFKWMAENNLDGVFFQRFLADLPGGNLSALRNQVAVNVRVGAETHGRVFAIMYDITGYPTNTLISKLTNDWLYLVNTQHVTNSPAYLRHKGKPVVAIWGFGYSDRDDTPAHAQQAISWFKAAGCTVMGGVPAGWRTLGTAGSDTDPAWSSAFRAFDVISPWTVGSYQSNFEADWYRLNYTVDDLAECASNGIDYLPVIFPGFSWKNLKDGPYNQIPRNGGNFYWRQAYNAVRSGCTMIYGAMFDEVDEGTAMFKMAPTAAQLPAQGTFVPLNVDGYNLNSDWYLRLADQAGRMLRGEIPQSATIPITPP